MLYKISEPSSVWNTYVVVRSIREKKTYFTRFTFERKLSAFNRDRGQRFQFEKTLRKKIAWFSQVILSYRSNAAVISGLKPGIWRLLNVNAVLRISIPRERQKTRESNALIKVEIIKFAKEILDLSLILK